MSELGEYLGGLGRDVEDMKQSLSPHGGTPALLIFSSDSINFKQVDLIIKQTSYATSNSFLVGHSVNGIVGAANGLGGGQIVIGSNGNITTSTTAQRRYIWRTESNLNDGTLSGVMTSIGGELKLR